MGLILIYLFFLYTKKNGWEHTIFEIVSFIMRKRSSKQIQSFDRVDSLISATSSHRTNSVKQDLEPQERQDFHQEQMRGIHQKIFIKKIAKQLLSLIARSQAPQDLTQSWQEGGDNQDKETANFNQSFDDRVLKLYPFIKFLYIIQGVFLVFFLWCISITVVFQQKIFNLTFVIIGGFELLLMLIKGIITNTDSQLSEQQIFIKMKKCLTPMITILTCVLNLIDRKVQSSQFHLFTSIFMIICFLFLVREISGYFKAIKQYAQSKKLIKELRIIQLFCTLFGVAHIFALIIYSSIYLRPEGELYWLNCTKTPLDERTWGIRYIYSLYWALTTIVTVGFGDLTPQNEAQVIVMMILEVVGTSFFGYMINVIGITVDNINKKNEEYDNYQQTISKLKDHYQLSQQLCSEMKRDIENKYNQQDQIVSLKKNEENDFLEYVDSTVKKNFILQTNIRIIKKSIFFLTYFTVNFQNYVALKLIRTIYKKDQNIDTFDPVTRQRNIIIVNHGKVDIFIEKRQNNVVKSKLVRTIEPIEGKPTLNVIGYSSLILNQNIDLFASANEMTSGYILRMSDVLECIDKSMIDYESFHQMRQKMLLYSMKQSIQAPALKDSSLHFTPNIFILACKRSKLNKQQRSKADRIRKRGFLVIDKVKTYLAKEWYTVNQDESENTSDDEFNPKIGKKIDDFQSLISIQQIQEANNITHKNHDYSKLEQRYLEVDQVKIFQFFMKNHNVNHVAVNYEKACSYKSYKDRIQSVHIKKIQTIKDMQKKDKKMRILRRSKPMKTIRF